MATREDIKNRIISKVVSSREITLPEMLTALQSLTAAERAKFLKALNSNRRDVLGDALLEVRKKALTAVGDTIAEGILADDTISLSELDYIL